MSKTYVVVPAFNEEEMIGSVLQKIKKQGFRNIVVVDDGSSDSTAEIAKREKAIVLRNVVNRGLGCTLNIGIEAAIILGAEIIVTCDSDGQHDPSEIKKLIKPILEKKAEVVIGVRSFDKKDAPFSRLLISKGAKFVNLFLFGNTCNDTESGFRAFSREAAGKINIQTSRMEVSSEIVQEIGRNNLKLAEVPIKTIYTDYSLRKGQKLSNAFSIVNKLFLKKIIK